MTREDRLALLDRHQDAFLRRDAAALGAQHAEHGTFESPAHKVEGRASIEEVYRYWFTAFPDLALKWGPPVVDGSRAAIFWTLTGTSEGPFFGIAGAGQQVELAGAAEYVIDDGTITSVRHIFDFSGLLMKTGVLKVKPV